MMKILINTTLLLLALLLPVTATAHDFEVDGIYYNILNDNEVAVTNRGNDNSSYSGEVTIPTSVTYSGTTYSVTTISNAAFYNSIEMTSIDIPNSVITIGDYAFADCRNLTNVTIPNSVTTIGEGAFCNYYGSSDHHLSSVTIGNSVTSIGNYAFYCCYELSDVTIGSSVVSIGEGVFYKCYRLEDITIPGSVTSIGNYTFAGCSSLINVTVADDNQKYDSRDSCNAIIETASNTLVMGCKNTMIPNSVNAIGEGAFYGIGLSKIIIPDAITSIDDDAFGDCSSLTTIISKSLTPPEITSSTFMSSHYSKATLYVERSSIDNYKSANYWKDFLKIPESTYGFEKDGIYYNILSDNTVEVTYEHDCYNSYSANVTIPAKVSYGNEEYIVTAIGDNAFRCCSGLTSVTIPCFVTSIGDFAFRESGELTNVAIGNSVTSIGDYAFYNCSNLTNVTIPNSVTTIGSIAFASCTGLTSITIGSSVTSIGESAFYRCSGLTSIIVESSNPIYDSRNNCNAIIETASNTLIAGCKNTVIPNSVTAIGEYAFYECSGLTKINIPNTVTSIGRYAFYQCSGLTSVNIPNSIITIGEGVFSICTGLTNVTIPNSVTTIGYAAFDGCSSLTSVNIPSSVLTIGDYSFSYCTGLTNVSIPCSVTAIGNAAFSECSSLTSINIPSSVLTIGDYSFSGCTGLTNVTIPNSVTAIGNATFSGCRSLTSVDIPGSVLTIGNYSFSGCTGLINVTIPNSVTAIGGHAFQYCSALTSISIPNSVTAIGDYAFYNCSELVSVSIPNSVTAIGNSAFEGTKWFDNMSDGLIYAGLIALKYKGEMPTGTSITIRSGTLGIAGSAFSGCSGLSRISIPNSVTNIGSGAFSGCSELTSITIPNSVTNIGSSAFSGCSGLTSITIPSSVTTIGLNAFANCTGLTIMSVANGNSVYDSRDNCNGIIETASNTLISGCKKTVIPYSVTSIGNYAFYYCRGLDSITIPKSVTSICRYAFYGCSGLSNIDISNSVTSIDYVAFSGCSSLTSIDIPNSVTTIGNMAFNGCSSLTCVTIPNSVTAIYAQVFQNCTALTDVYCYITDLSTVTGESLFYNYYNHDYSGRTLHVPVGSVEYYQHSDKWAPYFGNIVELGLQVEDVTVLHGDTIVVPVCLTNAKDVMAFQTDIFLPEGFRIVMDEDDEYVVTPSNRLTGDHGIMTNDANNGSVRVICYTFEPKPISGNNGPLFYMKVAVPDDAEGDYDIFLHNTRLTGTDYSETTLPDVGANIHVNAFLRGDANNSRTVNVADIVTTARYVLYMNPTPFVFAAADMNNDGEISVTDMMQIARQILNPTFNAPRHAPMADDIYDSMSADDFITLLPDETCTVSLVLDNAMSYSGFQLDLNLPEGLMASNFQLTDRAGGHAFDVNMLENGKIRALCYAPNLAAISGNSGTLLTFDVSATDPVHDDIMVNGIELVTTDCKMVRLNNFTIGVRNSTALTEMTTSKTVTHVEYYNLAGQRLTKPEGGATIAITTYSDGTRTTTKILQ